MVLRLVAVVSAFLLFLLAIALDACSSAMGMAVRHG
jgi:hypothetical protein